MFFFNPFHIYVFIYFMGYKDKKNLKSKQKFVFTQILSVHLSAYEVYGNQL
jgi:hypothetical protein